MKPFNLDEYLILELTEILSEVITTQDGTFLLIDVESAEGLVEMIQEQIKELRNKPTSAP